MEERRPAPLRPGSTPKEVQRPSRCNAPICTGGLQHESLEPVTVLPGRGRASSADLVALLDEFCERLPGGVDAPPRHGTFVLAREIFRQRGLSRVLEVTRHEKKRDVFHFVCGICWRLFMESDDFSRRIGIVFLVYLLYHAQSVPRCDIPLDVVVAETLADIREECERRCAFLECPKILFQLCQNRAVSVGVRATYRNVFFDSRGLLGERLNHEPEDMLQPPEAKRVRFRGGAAAVASAAVGQEEMVASAPGSSLTPRTMVDLSSLTAPDGEEGISGSEDGTMTARSEKLSQAHDLYEQDIPSEPLPVAALGLGREAHARPRQPKMQRKVLRNVCFEPAQQQQLVAGPDGSDLDPKYRGLGINEYLRKKEMVIFGRDTAPAPVTTSAVQGAPVLAEPVEAADVVPAATARGPRLKQKSRGTTNPEDMAPAALDAGIVSEDGDLDERLLFGSEVGESDVSVGSGDD